jgi:hypothetical protein
MVKEKKPSFLFLIETISRKSIMEWIRVKLGFAGMFVVEPVGRSGGLALLWKEENELEIQNYSRRHINAIVTRAEEGVPWKLAGFYGNPDSTLRNESWSLLRHLKNFAPQPWLCVGDFNEITHQEEKTGDARRREGQMVAFRLALEDCYLTDLGYNGPRFTWSNKRMDGSFTRVRLDRAVATSTWCEQHRGMEVCVLATRASDHNPLLIVFDKKERHIGGRNRGFKFEDKWWLEPDYGKIIEDTWRGSCMAGRCWRLEVN